MISPFTPRSATIGIVFLSLAAVSCRKSTGPDAYGNIEATEVVVASQSTGQLLSFTPVEGTTLPLGAVAAVVDTSALQLQLEQALAQRTASGSRVTEVQRQIGVLEAQRIVAERAYERTKRLAAQQAATAVQLDQTERDYRTLVAQIEAAKAQRQTASQDVASTETRAAQVRDQLRKSRVVNPVGGTVLNTYAKAGEFVQVGQPLYKIANLDTVELRAYVAETQLAQVRPGRLVHVSVDAGGDGRRTLPGTVSWVSSQAEFTPTPIETRDERANLVYAIKVRLANPNGILKIGMPADVELNTLASR